MHSALSGDAGAGGTKLMPRDVYRFARGEQVMSNTGQPVKLGRPLDFMALTEHTDGMGVITDILNGALNIMADPQGKQYHDDFTAGGDRARKASYDLISQFAQGTLSKALLYQPGNPAFGRTWEDLVLAAEEYNEPHRFTTLIAYEWTSLVKGNNLHRNVIFRDGPERALRVLPFTMTPPMGSPDPRDLWKWLQDYEDETGGQVLAIPHNGNLSNGMLFAMQDDFQNGAPFDRAYAETRHKWEPLMEPSQTKGDGETHPVLSPTDEFADYETWDWANLDMTEKKNRRDIAPVGYSKGVPMGADLSRSPDGVAPTFLVAALRDPDGANLDRVQIIKGWLDADDKAQEQVYDVAWSGDRTPGTDGKLPPVGDTVDLSVPTWTNTIGAAQLSAVWTDPDFDANVKAFYYVRVIEIPTPRWTAYDRVRYNLDLPAEVPLKTQERAYTSPIWYSPDP